MTGLPITLSIEYLQYWNTSVESQQKKVSAGRRTGARFTGTGGRQPR